MLEIYTSYYVSKRQITELHSWCINHDSYSTLMNAFVYSKFSEADVRTSSPWCNYAAPEFKLTPPWFLKCTIPVRIGPVPNIEFSVILPLLPVSHQSRHRKEGTGMD
jgi:hypothetical protein